MKVTKRLAVVVLAVTGFVATVPPAKAAINSMNLGANYDSSSANVIFRVYSS